MVHPIKSDKIPHRMRIFFFSSDVRHRHVTRASVLGDSRGDTMRLKVLLVDDDLFILTGFRKVLQRDHDVKCATDEETAINIARRFRPDVVLVDLLLGWNNGLDAIEHLRKLLPDAHLVLMTGYARGTDIILEARDAGADSFLWKHEGALVCELLDRVAHVRAQLCQSSPRNQWADRDEEDQLH